MKSHRAEYAIFDEDRRPRQPSFGKRSILSGLEAAHLRPATEAPSARAWISDSAIARSCGGLFDDAEELLVEDADDDHQAVDQRHGDLAVVADRDLLPLTVLLMAST